MALIPPPQSCHHHIKATWDAPSIWKLFPLTAELSAILGFQCHLFPTVPGCWHSEGYFQGGGEGIYCDCCWPSSHSLSTAPPQAGQPASRMHNMRSPLGTISHPGLASPGLCCHLLQDNKALPSHLSPQSAGNQASFILCFQTC